MNEQRIHCDVVGMQRITSRSGGEIFLHLVPTQIVSSNVFAQRVVADTSHGVTLRRRRLHTSIAADKQQRPIPSLHSLLFAGGVAHHPDLVVGNARKNFPFGDTGTKPDRIRTPDLGS
jgi:hypothetical protein